jgi:uncharacterized protein (TIGR00725 family)
MTKRIIIGVMGAGEGADPADVANAFVLGQCIAAQGWVLLSGGRNVGVMDAVSKGAKASGGLTIGILPTIDPRCVSDGIDIPILTGMGSARNNINVLTSDVVIACGTGGAGTLSEIALAIKAGKPVVLLNADEPGLHFLQKLGGGLVFAAESPDQAIGIVSSVLEARVADTSHASSRP